MGESRGEGRSVQDQCNVQMRPPYLYAMDYPLPGASAPPTLLTTMNFSRRDFLKSTGLACGATALPGWVFEAEAAEAARINKDELADIAIAQAKKSGATYA